MDEKLRILARAAALGDLDAHNRLAHYLDSLATVVYSTKYDHWRNFATAQRDLNALAEFVVNLAAEKIPNEYYPDKIGVVLSLVTFTQNKEYSDMLRPDRIYYVVSRVREIYAGPQRYYAIRVRFTEYEGILVDILGNP